MSDDQLKILQQFTSYGGKTYAHWLREMIEFFGTNERANLILPLYCSGQMKIGGQ